MKSLILYTASGPVVILTSHSSISDAALISKLRAKGIEKFLACEVPLELAKARYGGHFDVVVHDIHQSNDLRVLDFNGERVFQLFRFSELSEFTPFEPAERVAVAASNDDVS